MASAIVYVRQSITRDEDSLSLETQERLLRELAHARSLAVVAAYPDPDRRGWDEERPGLAAALARCEAGGITHFLVYDVSRLARSVRLQEQLVHRLSALGIELVSYREPHAGTPLFRQILGAIAEEQTRVISANWRRVLRGRSQRGLAHGIVPWGYRKAERGGPLEPDPDLREIVRDLFENYSAGAFIQDLANDLTRRGIPTPRAADWWTTQTVATILDNPVYAGFVASNGERLPGAHEAIVPPELFAAVEARRGLLQRPARPKPCTSWLEGAMYHRCGAKMHLFCSPPTRPTESPRFRCWRNVHRDTPVGPCYEPRTSIAVHLAEPVVRQQLARDLVDTLPIADVVAVAKAETRRRAPGATERRSDLEARRARVAERRHKAEELYLSGVRDRPWFDAQDGTCATELAEIAHDLAALPAPIALDEVRERGHRLRDLARAIAHAPDDRLGAILREVGIVVIGEDGPTVVYREAFGRHLRQPPEQTADRFLAD